MSLRFSRQSYPSDTVQVDLSAIPHFLGRDQLPQVLGQTGCLPWAYFEILHILCHGKSVQSLNLYILDTGAQKMLMRVCMESARKEKAMMATPDRLNQAQYQPPHYREQRKTINTFPSVLNSSSTR